ncbi:MAG: NAD(P)/FAD-dependent oxidoreductase [Alphaproteobacteria bacterium]
MSSKKSAGGSPHYTVLGAGIVGIACALELRRAGFAVSLIDRDGPGEGATSGNAGFIQTGTPIPLGTPGILRELPKLLFDPKSPLSVRWRYLPRLTPFLLRVLAASRPRRVERIAADIQALLERSGEAHRNMLRRSGGGELFRARGLLFVYPSEASFRKAQWEIDLFKRQGVEIEALFDNAVRQMEPALAREYRWANHFPDTFYTVDPLALAQKYAARFVALGGEIVRDNVKDIELGGSGPSALLCESGRRPIDRLVLAAGAFSKPFAKRLGVSVPLETGRGYHLHLPQPGVRLQAPIVDGEAHFGLTPMAGGVRLAGTMEFASLDAPANDARADMLLAMAQKIIPGLDGADAVRWMGHRPMMPDALPVIGRAPGHEHVLLAFGHGMLGLTMAAATGEIIAQLARGETPEIDLEPYRPNRF